jgi:hypothetical protein
MEKAMLASALNVQPLKEARMKLSRFTAALLVVMSLSFPKVAQSSDDEGIRVDEREVMKATKVKEKHGASLFKRKGVVGVGVGLSKDNMRVVIRVYVNKSQSKGSLPSELDGIPVEVKETKGFIAANGVGPAGHQKPFPPPVPLGTSTGNAITGRGTLGFRVIRMPEQTDPKVKPDPASAEVGYITAGHVAASTGGCPVLIDPDNPTTLEVKAFDGTAEERDFIVMNLPNFELAQCQPSLAEGFGCAAEIGKLTQFIPLIGGSFTNTLDAAFVESSRACVSSSILDIGLPGKKAAFPKLGAKIRKSGRKTGFTEGIVRAVNTDTVVTFVGCGKNGEDAPVNFTNQAVIEPRDVTVPLIPIALPGDSGAPVLKGKTPIGMLLAAEVDGTSATFTPLPVVLSALGVELDSSDDTAGACAP